MFRLLGRKRLPPPKVYYIELTNHCNLRCVMCNFHSGLVSPQRRRPKGFMDPGLAREIVAQIDAMGQEASVVFHGAGESLLHRGFTDILGYAARFGNVKAGFLTNAMLLDEEMSAAIIEAGPSWVGFSLDGIVKEKFERYRRGGDFGKITSNVLRFLEMRNNAGSSMGTKVNMTLQEEMKEDLDSFVDFWIDKVDEVLVSPFRPVGTRDNELARGASGRVPCYMLYEMMVIYWDGRVGLCCEDWFNDGDLGDVRRQGIQKIWQGKKFGRMRALHEGAQYDLIPLCRDCNSWYNATPEVFCDERRACHVSKNAWQYVYARRCSTPEVAEQSVDDA